MPEPAELIAHKEKMRNKIRHNIKVAKELRSQFMDRLATALITALGVVTALFWQAAITDTIKAFFPSGSGWSYEIVVAFIVTCIAVVVIFILSQRKENEKK